jgi:hypothetical protein
MVFFFDASILLHGYQTKYFIFPLSLSLKRTENVNIRCFEIDLLIKYFGGKILYCVEVGEHTLKYYTAYYNMCWLNQLNFKWHGEKSQE